MTRRQAKPKPKDILVAESEAMRGVVATVEELAECDAPVLIVGERGAGRELIARVLHFASPRRKRELITVHAEMAPEVLHYDPSLATSHDTLRAAQGGTLLIKELSDLPKKSQTRLERVLQRRRGGHGRDDSTPGEVYDVRIVGSCEVDLALAVDAGVFSGELYALLAENRIDVPPLRERTADVPPLAAQCIRAFAKELGRGRMSVSTRAYERLVQYPWPGNVAELKAICRKLVLACRSRIEAGDVDAILPMVAERVPLEDLAFEDMVRAKIAGFLRRMDGYPVENLYEEVLARVERPLLALVMEHTGGNQVKAAEILGVNRNTLRRKLAERGLKESASRAPARTKKTSPAKTRAAKTSRRTQRTR